MAREATKGRERPREASRAGQAGELQAPCAPASCICRRPQSGPGQPHLTTGREAPWAPRVPLP
eukprot:5514398-Alexandrium_andersonii.AAC.1